MLVAWYLYVLSVISCFTPLIQFLQEKGGGLRPDWSKNVVHKNSNYSDQSLGRVAAALLFFIFVPLSNVYGRKRRRREALHTLFLTYSHPVRKRAKEINNEEATLLFFSK